MLYQNNIVYSMYNTSIIIKKSNNTYSKKKLRILDIDGFINNPFRSKIFLRELYIILNAYKYIPTIAIFIISVRNPLFLILVPKVTKIRIKPKNIKYIIFFVDSKNPFIVSSVDVNI